VQFGPAEFTNDLHSALSHESAGRVASAFRLSDAPAALPAFLLSLARACESASQAGFDLETSPLAQVAAIATSRLEDFKRGGAVPLQAPKLSATEFPLLASFLAPVADDLRTRIDALRLLLFLSVLSGEDQTAQRHVADALRKAWSLPSDWGALASSLPEPNGPGWIPQLLAAAEAASRKLSKRQKFADRAQRDFLLSLCLILDRIGGFARHRGFDVEGEEEGLAEEGNLHLPEDFDPQRGREDATDTKPPTEGIWLPQRQDEGVTATRILVSEGSLPNAIPESSSVATATATRQAYQLIELDQRLRWSWDYLNPFETQLLRTRVIDGLDATEPAAILCALMLASGQSPEDTCRFSLTSPLSNQVGIDLQAGSWWRPVPRPPGAWSAPPEGHDVLVSTVERVGLPLPSRLLSALRAATRRNRTASTVGELLQCGAGPVAFLSAWLEPLRRRFPNARLTHGRISRALRVELMAATGDEAAAFTLASQPADVPPSSLYYTSFHVSDLQKAYATAVEVLLGKTSGRPAAEGIAGSHLTLSSSSTKAFVAQLKVDIAGERESGSYIRAHNRFVRYVLWLLFFATGHRPTVDPFEALDLFDAEFAFVTINDKVSFVGKDGRLVPLAPVVVQQLDRYRRHLELLYQRCRADGRNVLADQVRMAHLGRIGRGYPLFFPVEEESGIAQRIGRKELLDLMGDLRQLNANFPRHRLSQVAVAMGLSRELVGEMLGHLENSQPALGPRSPLSPQDFNPVRAAIETDLRSIGFEVLPSPLPDPADPIRLQPGNHARRELLGTALRERSTRVLRERASQRARELVRKHLGRPVRADQAGVNALFSEILHGKRRLKRLSDIVAYEHASRVVRQLKYRKGWPLKLPRHLSLPRNLTTPFNEYSLAGARLAAALRAQFHNLLALRARLPTRTGLPAPSRAAAEAIVSLVLDSRVVDVDVVTGLVESPRIPTLDTGELGIYTDIAVVNRSAQPEVRRYRLHPLTALLSDRLARVEGSGVLLASCTREFCDLVRRIGIEAGHDPDFASHASARVVARWLTDIATPLVRLELPGNVAGYLEGVHKPVCLPLEDWVRVTTGRQARDEHRTQPPQTQMGAARPDIEPAASVPPRRENRSDGEARARGLAFHREITNVLRDSRSPGKDAKQTIRTEVRRRREQATELPEVPALLAEWLEHLAEHGSPEGALAPNSCARYYFALAPRLIEVLPAVRLAHLNDDALAMAYSDFMETVPGEGQHYVFRRLQEFHQFLMDRQGFPTVEWSEVAPLTCVKSVAVDAGFLTWSEYEHALELLRQDRWANERERVMQATAWLLTYRFGARISEALGLRRKDAVFDGSQVIVLFRPNDYRDIKTTAGVRQVPLIGPLSAIERQLLDDWLSHIDEYADTDWLAPIFAQPQQPRAIADREAIARRIAVALKAVTGSDRARPHYGRHAFATRLEWLMTIDDLPSIAAARETFERVVGPCRPRETRRLLLDTESRTKRAFWAAAVAIGHASPDMTFRTYAHLGDLLSGRLLGPVFDRDRSVVQRSAWRYVTGDAPLPRRRMSRGGRPITLSDQVVRDVAKGLQHVRALTEPRRAPQRCRPARSRRSFSRPNWSTAPWTLHTDGAASTPLRSGC
jgi:integrase